MTVGMSDKVEISVVSDTGVTIEVASGDSEVATIGVDGTVTAKKTGTVTYRIYTKETNSYNKSNVENITITVSQPSEPSQPETPEESVESSQQ